MLEKTNHNSAPKEITDALITLYHQGKFDDVVSRSSQLIQQYPHSPILHNILGATNIALGNYTEAIINFKKVITLNFHKPSIFYNLGLAYHHIGNMKEAIDSYCQAIQLQPDYAEAYCNMGMSFNEMGDTEKAIEKYQQTLKINPNHAGAYKNLGNVYNNKGDDIKAILCFKKVIDLNPVSAEAYTNLSLIYSERSDFLPAIKYCKAAIKLDPKNYKAYNNYGSILLKQKKYKSAYEKIKQAINLNANFDIAFNNLGHVYKEMNNFKESIICYKKALDIKKDAGYYYNLGLVLNLAAKYDKSINNLKKSVSIDPYTSDFLTTLLFDLNYSPDMSAEEIFDYYKQYDNQFGLPYKSQWKPFTQPKVPKKKLKIGYVSPDFRNHSMMNFLLPIITHHDRQQFEIFAFAELKKEDSLSLEYKSLVDHWIRTDPMSDDQLVEKIRSLEIDILVDLAGHTCGNRLKVFAQKPAPISLTWLGFGYTTGLSAIDYFLTDEVMAPKGSEHLFSEQPWHLKNYSFCCYKNNNTMGNVNTLPALKNGCITFGTLTRAIRINDRVIQAWAQILQKVKNSRLTINSKSFLKKPSVVDSLKKKFEKHGITANRLDFYYKTPPWDSMREIDIALDCFPHNSGTTLMEHLYMGTPYVTYSNRPSVGRIGASILTTLGHPEWIATSEQEYVEKTVALASDTQALAKIRGSLRKEMEASSLMDHAGFVLELERAYQAMWMKWCSS